MNVKTLTGLVCAMLLGVSAFAANTNTNAVLVLPQVKAEQWVLTIGGTGVNDTQFSRNTQYGMDLSLGRTGHLLLPMEAGIRQSINYSDALNAYNKNGVILNTKAYADWTLLSYKALDLFAGGNIGAIYGNTTLGWEGAPEVGARVWLNKNLALIVRAEYTFNLASCTVSPGQDTIRYFAGLAIKF